ncbi:50S ribosomal protein L7/L12 [Carya illinoinensis]|uniref:50S ribosomal protein L7/L12 n=1 Tax=Carya illinoinensis TaxID=32201 RepID=UPI001C71C654|nr:50S ribosomal protein L7/L12 [Carya illinoinensis]
MRYIRFISHIQKSFRQNPIPNFPPTTNPNVMALIQSKTSSSRSSCLLNSKRGYTSSVQKSKSSPSERVSEIVDELMGLTLLEVSDLVEVLRDKLGVTEMPTMMVMMPGMVPGALKGAAGKGGAAPKAEEKTEKTVFDVKLEGFDAAAKIKVIKEVRTFTDLGLKEAKDLVEKAPTLLKKGVTKDEAEKIIAKLKEIGAKVSME